MPARKTLALVLSLAASPSMAQDADALRREAVDAVSAMGFESVSVVSATMAGDVLVASAITARLPRPSGKPEAAPIPVRARGLRLEGVRIDGLARTVARATLEGVESGEVAVERVAVADLAVPAPPEGPRFSALQGQTLTARSPDGGTVTVDGFRLAHTAWKDGLPSASLLQVRAASVKGGQSSLLYALAPDLPRSLDLDIPTTQDAHAGRLSIDDGNLWLGAAARLRFSARFTGIEAAKAGALGAVGGGAQAAGALKVEAAEMRLENTGLAQSLLTLKGKLEGTTPQGAGDALVRQAEGLYPRRAGDPALRAQALAALRAFVADPRSLGVSLAPPAGGVEPGQVLGAYQGSTTAKALGLAVRANAPARESASKP